MIPTWLTIELAMIPVVIAGLGGLVWLIRLEGVVTFNKSILDEKYKNLLEKYKNLKEKLDSHSTESDSYRENQIRMEEQYASMKEDLEEIKDMIRQNGRKS